MVEDPAKGKADNCLVWNAGGLEMNLLKDKIPIPTKVQHHKNPPKRKNVNMPESESGWL